MGRQTAADRGGVGIRGARWADRKPYPWGDEFRRERRWMANTHQGHFPDHDTGDGCLHRRRAGGAVSAEWLRPLRHGRKRVGVDRRLVPAGLLRATRRGAVARNPQGPDGRVRSREPAAEACPSRRFVPVHRSRSARATWWAREARARGYRRNEPSRFPPGAQRVAMMCLSQSRNSERVHMKAGIPGIHGNLESVSYRI